VEWKWFESFVMLIIFLNCLSLALYDYQDRRNYTRWNQRIELAGQIFTALFVFEFVLKAVSMGFCFHKKSYLRDGWNWIDFLVVLVGILEFFPTLQYTNIKALRTIRVIRPLRSINTIPGLRR